jgi:DNA-binding NarL/FixJ family response regulator
MPAVAIIESHRILRTGIEQLLARDPEMKVVASVGSVDELTAGGTDASASALGFAPTEGPGVLEVRFDVVIADVSRHSGDCLRGIIAPLAALAPVLVVAAAEPADPTDVLRVVSAGAHGLVTSYTDDDEFLVATSVVAGGGFYVTASVAPHLARELSRYDRVDPQGLATREIETLVSVASGLTHGQIARRMGLTEATVNTYVKRIRAKLNAGNKAELTRKAIELGYLSN